jgi:hypothetical protein
MERLRQDGETTEARSDDPTVTGTHNSTGDRPGHWQFAARCTYTECQKKEAEERAGGNHRRRSATRKQLIEPVEFKSPTFYSIQSTACAN